MSHLAGKFAGILRAELPPDKLEAALAALAALEARGLKVIAEPATGAVRGTDDRILDLELVGLTVPGLSAKSRSCWRPAASTSRSW